MLCTKCFTMNIEGTERCVNFGCNLRLALTAVSPVARKPPAVRVITTTQTTAKVKRELPKAVPPLSIAKPRRRQSLSAGDYKAKAVAYNSKFTKGVECGRYTKAYFLTKGRSVASKGLSTKACLSPTPVVVKKRAVCPNPSDSDSSDNESFH